MDPFCLLVSLLHVVDKMAATSVGQQSGEGRQVTRTQKPADGKGQMYHSIQSCKHGKAGGTKRERERETLLLFMAIVLVMRARSKADGHLSFLTFNKSVTQVPMHFHTLTRDQSPKTLAGFKENGWALP